eukprot:m.1485250 g.1485250  ORF g.1485250 m.1485250 type:complete len:168 (+) comp25181_c1_seq10:91-594(+)
MSDSLAGSRGDALDTQAIFKIYDEDNDGKLSSTEAIKAIRALGNCLSEKVATDLETDIDCDFGGECTLQEFQSFLEKVETPKISHKELLKAFRSLDDDDDGAIPQKELERILIALGEDMQEDEIADFMDYATRTGNNEVDVRKYCDKMFGRTRRRLSLLSGPGDAAV